MKWDDVKLEEQYLAAMQVSFDCARCGKCCQNMDGIAYNSVDCVRMADKLKLGVNEFRKQYTVPSAKKPGDRWLALVGAEQKCPFLGEKGCTQYEGRGQVCRFYPWFTASSVTAVREGRAYRFYPQCKGMVQSMLATVEIAEQLPFLEAEKILKRDFGKIAWLYMLVDEGREGKARKLANELGYANLPPMVDTHYWARKWAASYLVMMGPRKLENLKAEVEGFAASFGY